jgi:hypothetical protein
MAPTPLCATTVASDGSARNNTHPGWLAGKVAIPSTLHCMAGLAQLLQIAGIIVAVIAIDVIDLRETRNG